MKKKLLLTLMFFSLSPQFSSASVIINDTRVIFPSNSETRTVQIVNKSATEHLVQSWIDDGDEKKSPEELKTALTVYPPVVKINAGSGQALKIVKNKSADSLPQDRESAFWLNILDVPPIPEIKEDNYMQVAIRSRIKVLWRPAGIVMPVTEIKNHVHVKKTSQQSCLFNDTPYYLTIISFENPGFSENNEGLNNVIEKALFVPPFSCEGINKINKSSNAKSEAYRIGILDDFGSKKYFKIN